MFETHSDSCLSVRTSEITTYLSMLWWPDYSFNNNLICLCSHWERPCFVNSYPKKFLTRKFRLSVKLPPLHLAVKCISYPDRQNWTWLHLHLTLMCLSLRLRFHFRSNHSVQQLALFLLIFYVLQQPFVCSVMDMWGRNSTLTKMKAEENPFYLAALRQWKTAGPQNSDWEGKRCSSFY